MQIQEGAGAYLKRQYATISVVGVIIFLLVAYLLDPIVAVGFAIGAILSGIAGFVGNTNLCEGECKNRTSCIQRISQRVCR